MENKIQVIKAVREYANIGLREAMEIVNRYDENLASPAEIATINEALAQYQDNEAKAKTEARNTAPKHIQRDIAAIFQSVQELDRMDFDDLSTDEIDGIRDTLTEIIETANRIINYELKNL